MSALVVVKLPASTETVNCPVGVPWLTPTFPPSKMVKTSVVLSITLNRSAVPVPFTLKTGCEAWAETMSSFAAGVS